LGISVEVYSKDEVQVTDNSLAFSDFFDLNEVQRIQDSFSQATGVSSIITDLNGKPVTNPSNFCRFCTDIIQKTKIGMEN
jgi:ligand-binding sensor protein